jgi:hypothetical protein
MMSVQHSSAEGEQPGKDPHNSDDRTKMDEMDWEGREGNGGARGPDKAHHVLPSPHFVYFKPVLSKLTRA